MKNILFFFIGVVVAVGALYLVALDDDVQPFGYVPQANTFSGGVTTATTSIPTTVTSTNLVLARNADRQWARIMNEGVNSVTIDFISATSSLEWGGGIVLDAGESYEISTNNLYVGAIYGLASTAANEIITMEK